MKGPAASGFASVVEGWEAGMKTKQKLFEVGFAPLASSQRGVPTKLAVQTLAVGVRGTGSGASGFS